MGERLSDGRCGMARMIEADRDGRLDEREQASLARHLAACADCRALSGDLDRLAQLTSRPLAPPATPLEHQRGRLALLNDAALVGAPTAKPRSVPRLVLGLAAAAVLAVSAVGLGAPGAASGVRTVVNRVLGRDVGAGGPTAVAVAHKLPSLPRLADLRLDGGSAPNPPGEAVSTPGLVGEDPGGQVGASGSLRVDGVGRRDGAGRVPSARGGSAGAPASPARGAPSAASGVGGAESEDSKAFAEGMRLIARGDYAAGADKLDAYQHENPSDARAEDAAYLSVLALQRAGRREAAVAAARRYLQQYPKGYRRGEVQAILAEPRAASSTTPPAPRR